MRKIKALVASLALLSGVLLPTTAQANPDGVTYTKSSCRLQTTAGIVEKGRCKIKAYFDSSMNYIIVEIENSWDKERSYLRLTNPLQCNFWRYNPTNDEGPCHADMGDGKSWGDDYGILVGFGEYEKNHVVYTLGTAYVLFYDGFFKIPCAMECRQAG